MENSLSLNELIAIADAGYDDGLVQAYFDDRDGQHGDTLAKFIALELADTFSEDQPKKDQIAAAIHVMTTAISQLVSVVNALEAAC